MPPPKPVYEEWKEFTAPVEVSVVATAKIDEPAIPKRVSLPSMAPPAISKAGPRWANSVHIISAVKPIQMTAIAPRIAYPCFSDPTIRPKVRVSANGISRMRKISNRFDRGLGFSKGWAELALK